MELFVETYVWSDDYQKWVQQFMDSQAQQFMVCWFSTIFFLSYYFLEFDEFVFYDTYNSRLNERYGDDPSTHLNLNLDLWLEIGSSSGPNRNRMYKLSNTTTENLETTPLMF